ncbi:hypothetical protein [Novosphingobium sp. Chol11]|uniref:hypothetical protein n=1 Tax=Novosphingobium sp. Chol11 TaxID=1385763 RepID=UPI0020D23101|nr:hypothetical protein [Novosphingobium sp. Chol11]
MMIWLVLAATAFSVGLLTMLGLGDPKRRRAAGLHGGHGQPMRHLYVVGAVVPGVVIAYTGDAAMWLIWFGGSAVAGWIVALWLAQSGAERQDKSAR